MRLSKVRIFPSAAVQVKKATFKNLDSPNTSQGERSQDVYLPIMCLSNEFDIALKRSTLQNQMNCHERILVAIYVIQTWESFLEGHLSAPHIIPESDPGSISQNKSGMATKQTPPFPNVLSKPHSVRPKEV
jgi:hypothetical protein